MPRTRRTGSSREGPSPAPGGPRQAHVLIAADDPELVERARSGLGSDLFVLYVCPARSVLARTERVSPDLVILDVAPRPEGWALVRRLRVQSEVPLILLVADDNADERIEGLNRGADDCLDRSVAAAELRARVRAVLRRSQPEALSWGPVRVGELWLDPLLGQVHLRRAVFELRPHEFTLLLVLARNPGVVFGRQRLLQILRGVRERPIRPETLDVYATRVRRKLAGSGVVIQAVRGVGYKLVLEPEAAC